MRFYSTNQGENIKVITTPRLYSSVRAPNLVSASYSPLIRKLTHRHLHQKHTLSLRIPIILFIQPDTRLRPTRDSHNSLSCCLLGIMSKSMGHTDYRTLLRYCTLILTPNKPNCLLRFIYHLSSIIMGVIPLPTFFCSYAYILVGLFLFHFFFYGNRLR